MPTGLRHAVARRFRRRVPGREPGADVDAAAAEAAEVLRSRHRGGDRAAGPDPGRHGASLSAPARRHRARVLPLARSGARACRRAEEGPEPNAGRAALPGAGDADRHRRRQVHARRGRRAAARHGDLPPQRQRAPLPREVHRRHDAAAATHRTSPSAASSRSRASANTASPRATRRASRCSSTSRPGSNATIPDVFCAAILNSQPMGFYQPAQLVRDARQHGVEVREADVNCSDWDCTLEPASAGSRHRFAVRLGFRQIQGLSEEELEQADRGARQRLCQHRAAGRGRRRLALHASSASPRPMPSARSASTGARRCGRRGGSMRSASRSRTPGKTRQPTRICRCRCSPRT